MRRKRLPYKRLHWVLQLADALSTDPACIPFSLREEQSEIKLLRPKVEQPELPEGSSESAKWSGRTPSPNLAL